MLKPSIFISYKTNDPPTVKALEVIEPALVQAGFEIWRDVSIEPGAPWSNELYKWLMDCSGAVVILGPAAAASEWCRREWWFLRERHHTTGLPLVTVWVDGALDSAGILDEFQALRLADVTAGEIGEKLQGAPRAAVPSAQRYLAAHHAWLRYQFNDAKLWGREPFPLGAVYVETECGRMTWGEITQAKEPRDPFREENGGRHNLVEAVMAQLADAKFRDLMVVQGPPGCGKSAFTLRLADALLSRGLQPVLARFRDFRLTVFDRADELIEDALRIGPLEEEPPRPDESLFDAASLNRTAKLGEAELSELVFILDGWDEVALTGNTSYQSQLKTWLPRLREFFIGRPGPPVRLILTGRPSAEVRESGILRGGTPVLTVRPITPAALHGFAQAIARLLDGGAASAGVDTWRMDLERLAPL